MKTILIQGCDGKTYEIPEHQKADFESWSDMHLHMKMPFHRPNYARLVLGADDENTSSL